MDEPTDAGMFKFKTPDGESFGKRGRGRAAGVPAQISQPDNQYVLDLIQVLRGYPGGRRRWSIMQAIRANRRNAGLGIPHQIEDSIERAFLEHCADAEKFKNRNRAPESALFHWPQGKAAGMWAVYSDQIDAWLRDNIPGS
jgi:hypothetical protein